MMLTNYLVNINHMEDIETLKKVGITTFLFALDEFSIGYEKTFSVNEINNVKEDKYVLINRLLDSSDVDALKNTLGDLNVQGFVFEDIGLINILNDANIKGKKILFMNHFNSNYASINAWLKYVDSVIVSNELTEKEYVDILKLVNKPVVLQVFGYNEIMYSRRYLLSNFYKKFELNGDSFNTITDNVTHIKFHLVESKYGTVALSEHIYNGRRLLNKDNVLFYYLNTSFIKTEDTLKFLNGDDVLNSDEGFLDKPTIYKLRSDN